MEMHTPNDRNLRCGMAALIGRANVGKSSLLNRMLGEKVSIVSPVPQTTRHPVRGILTDVRGQIVFLDTPGIHAAQTDLGRRMNRAARAAVEGVDVVLLVLDRAVPPRNEDIGWMRRLLKREELSPVFLVLNKGDQASDFSGAYRKAWDEAVAQKPLPPPVRTFAVSALTGDGVEKLGNALSDAMPIGPLLFPEDVLTDYPRRLAIADTVREKLFLRLSDEVPHRVAVWVDDLIETPEGWLVETTVIVERHSQKGIVIGRKGRMLRAVRRASEADLREAYGRPVTVHLHVKVEPKWTRNYWILKKIGMAP